MKNKTKKFVSCILLFTMFLNLFLCEGVLYAINDNPLTGTPQTEEQKQIASTSQDLANVENTVKNANTGGRAEGDKQKALDAVDEAKKELGISTDNKGDNKSLNKLATVAEKAQKVILKVGQVVTKVGETLKKVGEILKIAGTVLKAIGNVPWLSWLKPIGTALINVGKVIYQIGNVMVKVGKAITAVGELTKGKDANFKAVFDSFKEAVTTGWSEGAAEYDKLDVSKWEKTGSDIGNMINNAKETVVGGVEKLADGIGKPKTQGKND